jgi:hypothetical protein
LIDKAFEEIKKTLMRSSGYPKEVSSAYLSEHGILGLKLDDYGSVGCSLTFQPPEAVFMTGSYAMGTSASPSIVCDVAIHIPQDCFEDRYFNLFKSIAVDECKTSSYISYSHVETC